MTDEEKKAMELLEDYLICGNKEGVLYRNLRIISRIIEKQSKEIEELKDEYNTKLLSNAGIYQLGFKDGKDSVKNKIKAMLENEIINISGFECVAKEDVQSLLEKE